MMDVYTTAFLIVLTTVVVALIGGYLVLSKLSLIRSRKPVVTDGALVELLKRFSLPKNKERVVDSRNQTTDREIYGDRVF